MKILITGANGLVGSAIARRFVEAGYDVFALVRADSDKTLLKPILENITFLLGDVLDVPSLEDAIEPMDYVVHTAAIVSFAPRGREQMYKVNVEGTANVVNVCLAKHIKKLVFVSSVAALGKPSNNLGAKNEILIDENQKWEDSPLNSHYAKSKYLAECEVWRGEAEGLKMLIVNPSLVLGEGDWERSSTKIFKYIFDEKPFYTLGNINYVDVQDIAEVVFQLTFSEISGERFILNGGTKTYQEVFNKIADAFGKKRPHRAVTPLLAETIWRIEALHSWFSGKEPLITKETAQSSRTIFAYNNQKILNTRANNFKFTELDSTIKRVCENILRK